MARQPTAEEGRFLLAMGTRLKQVRLSRGMSQRELADAALLSRVFVGAVERGRHGVNVLGLRRLARALRVQMADLIVEDDQRDPPQRRRRA